MTVAVGTLEPSVGVVVTTTVGVGAIVSTDPKVAVAGGVSGNGVAVGGINVGVGAGVLVGGSNWGSVTSSRLKAPGAGRGAMTAPLDWLLTPKPEIFRPVIEDRLLFSSLSNTPPAATVGFQLSTSR